MPSDEGGKVLIHEWKQHRFYIADKKEKNNLPPTTQS